MAGKLSLYGLGEARTRSAIRLLLFSPALEERLDAALCAGCADDLLERFAGGDEAGFGSSYREMESRIRSEVFAGAPPLAMTNPPWSMLSLDMLYGMIPWRTPGFEQFLHILFKRGRDAATTLPIAFVLSGGPGDSKATAFRICAPSQMVRASSEHWLLRNFVFQQPGSGMHMTLARDDQGRSYSLHRYTDGESKERDVYFETTESFGREAEDFAALLDGASNNDAASTKD